MASPSQPLPPSSNERQPLLAKPADEESLEPGLSSSEPQPDTPDTTTTTDTTEKDVDWTWTSIAWYAGLTTLGLIALGLLIKGFIDAGDTDVSAQLKK